MPRLILRTARAEVWELDGEFYVYGLTGDPRVVQSEGMARELAAGA